MIPIASPINTKLGLLLTVFWPIHFHSGCALMCLCMCVCASSCAQQIDRSRTHKDTKQQFPFKSKNICASLISCKLVLCVIYLRLNNTCSHRHTLIYSFTHPMRAILWSVQWQCTQKRKFGKYAIASIVYAYGSRDGRMDGWMDVLTQLSVRATVCAFFSFSLSLLWW